MSREIYDILEQMAQERDLPLDLLVSSLEGALANAYKKQEGMPTTARVRVQMDRPGSGGTDYRIFCEMEVVGFVADPHTQISLEDAQKIKEDIEVGDFLEVELPPQHYGRISAQTVLQVLKQKLRELEKDALLELLRQKVGGVVLCTIQRNDGRSVSMLINNRIDAILPKGHQAYHERYRINDRLYCYVLELKENESGKGVRVIVSRTEPNLVVELMKKDVPEVGDGTIEVKAVARKVGSRTKLAVQSRNPLVDAVGACIGHRGSRIQAITDELFGEKIDVIPWSRDPDQFIRDALNPARVNRIVPTDRVDEKTGRPIATVVVPNNQLSLAIGKDGVNVTLASDLTGYSLDVRSESQLAEKPAREQTRNNPSAESA